MAETAVAASPAPEIASFDARRRTADRIFRGALVFNALLTAFWLVTVLTQHSTRFFQHYNVDRETITRVLIGILYFNIIWGAIWWGVKSLLLKFFCGFSKEERRGGVSLRLEKKKTLLGAGVTRGA